MESKKQYIKMFLSSLFWDRFFLLYRLYIRWRIPQIKKKEKIRVLFVLAELSAWKTEMLYLAMKANKRFEAIIGVTTSMEVPGSKQPLIEYLKGKGYDYYDLDKSHNEIKKLKADLIFYYKPYDASYPKYISHRRNLRPIPLFINYCFSIDGEFTTQYTRIRDYSWFEFVENELVYDWRKKMLGWKASNVLATGTPMQDILLSGTGDGKDPWKGDGNKKRIIYAPHHSIKGTNPGGIEYSTILEYGEFILELAQKYKDVVQFAFKPHPTLYPKLIKIWGQERTDNYYRSWAEMENTQLELGEYSCLFKYSDALIHDSSSFIAEYYYTHKPAMFLEVERMKTEYLTPLGFRAYENLYHGHSKDDIEGFVKDIIAGRDEKYDIRESFFKEHLVPPNHRSASENIINAILE